MRRDRRGGQVDGGRIAPLEHAALRREDEVVERAAAHQLEHAAADGRVDGWKCGHSFILTNNHDQEPRTKNGSMPLREIEQSLRERLAGTLPGIEAQMRFAPELLREAWRTGVFPAESRAAAALLLLYPHDVRRRPPADGAGERARAPCRADQPAGRRDRSRRNARAGGASRGRRRNRRRSVGRAGAGRADAGARAGQRLHAAPDRRDYRPPAGLPRGARRGPGDPRGVAATISATPRESGRAPGFAKASRSSIPTSTSSGTRCGGPPPWCSASSSACSTTGRPEGSALTSRAAGRSGCTGAATSSRPDTSSSHPRRTPSPR